MKGDEYSRDPNSAALDYKNVSASDTETFRLARAIRFDVGGIVVLVKEDGTTATILAIAGKIEPLNCIGVKVTGTDPLVAAGNILAIYR